MNEVFYIAPKGSIHHMDMHSMKSDDGLELDPEWDFMLNRNGISKVDEENEDQDSSSGISKE